jgi:phosphopantothenoylcysteine synthetase/decarboxylase
MAIESNESSPEGRQRRSRILYAVTGSVAAVKGPEIAVRLVNELNFDVRILLTRGGENFWSKAKDYNLQYWNMLQELLVSNRETNTNDSQISMCCE